MSIRRQQKIGSSLKEALSEIFQIHGATFYGRAFVTITDVEMTPDLLVFRIYLSIYNVKEKEKALEEIKSHAHEIRRHLGNKMRNNLRRIPELLFYLDESLDNALRINELLKGIDKSSRR